MNNIWSKEILYNIDSAPLRSVSLNKKIILGQILLNSKRLSVYEKNGANTAIYLIHEQTYYPIGPIHLKLGTIHIWMNSHIFQ